MAKRLLIAMALAQLLLTLIGCFGLYAYFQEPPSNPSRYQVLLVTLLAFYATAPLLVLSLLDFWRCRDQLSRFEKGFCTVTNLAAVIPMAIAAAI